MDEATAFLDCNFAPPSLRRNIGILGLLHKRVLGEAHPIFQKLLPFHADIFNYLRPREHSKQLYCHILEVQRQQALHQRSIFGMVKVYNHLPQWLIDCSTVSSFQSHLTKLAREKCKKDEPDWKSMFSARH